MIKIGLCTIGYRDMALAEVLKLAANTGFDGVELWGKEPHMDSAFDADRVKDVRETVADFGIEVGVFGSYINPLMADFDSASDAAIRITKGLGASLMRIWSPPGQPGTILGEEYEQAVVCQKDFCRRAAESDVVLAIEAHDNYITETTAAMLQYLKDVDEPNLKVNWQGSWREHTDDFFDSLTALMPYVVNVHAQNFAGSSRERRFLDEGSLDYSRVFAELKQAGYAGYVEVEFPAGDASPESLRRDCDTLRRLAEKY